MPRAHDRCHTAPATALLPPCDLDIPVTGSPSTDPPSVPFNDLVLSSEATLIGGAPVTTGVADGQPFVAFTCGATTWTIGVGATNAAMTLDSVQSLTEALIPHMYCTVGERPNAPGHGKVP